jgi:hypothetical protein
MILLAKIGGLVELGGLMCWQGDCIWWQAYYRFYGLLDTASPLTDSPSRVEYELLFWFMAD